MRAKHATVSRLANGLEVHSYRQAHLRTAHLAVFIRAGSRYEDERTSGISHFVEHMLFRGTKTRPDAHDVNRALEELGAHINATTHPDYVVVEATAPAENAIETLAIICEMVREPLLADVTKEKSVIREEILETADSRGRSLDPDDLSRAVLFPKHPLGYRVTGALPAIDAFTVRDLRAHVRRHYVASNMAVVATGAVDPAAVVRAVRRRMRSVPRGRRIRANTPATYRGPRGRLVGRSGPQSDVRLSFHTVGELDPSRPALELLMQALDDGLGARVHRRLVDELGLAYEAFGGVDLYEDCGVVDFGAAAANRKVQTVVRALVDLVREVRDQGLDEEEIDLARKRFLWEQDALEDSPRGVASLIGTWALFGRRMSPATMAAMATRTRTRDVRQVARQVFRSSNAGLAIVGDLPGGRARRLMRCVDDLA